MDAVHPALKLDRPQQFVRGALNALIAPTLSSLDQKSARREPVRTPEKCSWQVLRERVIGIKERF